MKKLLVMLLVLIALSGCRQDTDPTITNPENPPVVSQEQEETGSGESLPLRLELEHAVYDPSVKRMTYFVHNDSNEAVEFGQAYSLQRLENGMWTDLIPQDSTAWISIAYYLQSGGTMALTCSFDLYEETPTAGTYRLVKEVSGQTLYAEFELGESIYTAETPYGFIPLEQLEKDYHAGNASERDVIFTEKGAENLEAVMTFLEKSAMGVDCQLRTVQDYGEGAPMVIDVIRERDHYLWRMWSEGTVFEKRFSYIVSDGKDLYLSNGADWETTKKYQSNVVFLIPEGVTVEMLAAVERQTAGRLTANLMRYRIWQETEDGIWSAALFDGSEFPDEAAQISVEWSGRENEGGWGKICDLESWGMAEADITAIEWQNSGNLQITCEKQNGESVILEFDPRTDRVLPMAD